MPTVDEWMILSARRWVASSDSAWALVRPWCQIAEQYARIGLFHHLIAQCAFSETKRHGKISEGPPSVEALHTCELWDKKLSYCWDSSRCDKISDSGRSANPTVTLNMTYVQFISLIELPIRGILYRVMLSANTPNYFKSGLDR